MGDRYDHFFLAVARRRLSCKPIQELDICYFRKKRRKLTVRAINDASSPWALYQSPRSNMRTVSSSFSGSDLKKRMKPPSSSSYQAELASWKRPEMHIHLQTLSSGRDDILRIIYIIVSTPTTRSVDLEVNMPRGRFTRRAALRATRLHRGREARLNHTGFGNFRDFCRKSPPIFILI